MLFLISFCFEKNILDRIKRQSCPAANSTCNNCGKKGHFQAVCKSSKAVREVLNDEPSSLSENNPFLGAIHNAKRSNKEWSIEVCLDNTRINFKINTGADVDIISDKIYMYTSHFSHKPLLPSTKGLCRISPSFAGSWEWLTS